MTAFYFTGDLFFSSRVTGVAQRLGLDLRVIGSIDKLLEGAECDLVLIDLTVRSLDIAAAVRSIRDKWPQARIVAYGPHVQVTLLEAAQAAGCDEVLSRGQFDRDLERVLRPAS